MNHYEPERGKGAHVLQKGVEEVVVVSQFFYGVEECGEGDAVPANRQFLDMDTAVFVCMEIVGLDLAGVQVEAAVEFMFLAELFEGLGLLLPDVTGLDELVDALQEVVAVRGQVKEGGFVDQNGEQIGDFDLHVGVKLGFGIFQTEDVGDVGPVHQMEQQRTQLLDGGGGGCEGNFGAVGQFQGEEALPVGQFPAKHLFDQRGDEPAAGLSDG